MSIREEMEKLSHPKNKAARDELKDPFSSPEEDEAWKAAEKRIDAIGHNGGTGEHYESPASKYHVQIKGQWVDVYDIRQPTA